MDASIEGAPLFHGAVQLLELPRTIGDDFKENHTVDDDQRDSIIAQLREEVGVLRGLLASLYAIVFPDGAHPTLEEIGSVRPDEAFERFLDDYHECRAAIEESRRK